MSEVRLSAALAHITLNEAEGKADCALCKSGVTVPPSFGGIPQSSMLASFVVMHAAHTKAGHANGLTATGKPSKAAALALAALTAAPETGGTQVGSESDEAAMRLRLPESRSDGLGERE